MTKLKKRKKWLTKDEVERILSAAEAVSHRDYLIILLMRWGLRVGEVVGYRGLPGIYKRDLRQNGIWVKGKGYAAGIVQDALYPIPPNSGVMDRLRAYSAQMAVDEKLFDIDGRWAEDLVKRYAQQANIEDWELVTPHRFRAFFDTDAQEKGIPLDQRTALMRHKHYQTTEIYEKERGLPFEKKQKILETLSG